MLNSLRLQNYKRFRDLRFEGFQRVNLFTGKNNCGKTAVLEAILLLLGWKESANDFAKVFRPGQGEHLGDANEHFWKWLFPLRKLTETPQISGEISEVGPYSVILRWQTDGPPLPAPAGMTQVRQGSLVLSITGTTNHQRQTEAVATGHQVTVVSAQPRSPSKEAQDYARVTLKSDGEEQVEEMLRKLEPRLRAIRSLQPYGVPLLYAGIAGMPERIPVIQLGHGFSRLLTIMAEIVASERPIVLIDEIENGLHHSALIDIWRGLLTACEHSNVQIFATTHSWECVSAAHQAFSESLEYPLRVYRLEEVRDEIQAIAYDRESLEFSVQQELEVR